MRALTGMLAGLMVMTGAARADETPRGTPLFSPCETALGAPEFAPVARILDDRLRSLVSGCLRLTKQEFLLVSGSGPDGNFYYCDLRAREPACAPAESGFYYYGLDLLEQFTGAHGKRYVLWSTGRTQRGIFRSGYGIFSLVPRARDARGFAVQSLDVGSEKYLGDGPADQPCYELGAREAHDVTGYEVVAAGTGDVALRFTDRVTDCASGEASTRVVVFRPVNGEFTLAR